MFYIILSSESISIIDPPNPSIMSLHFFQTFNILPKMSTYLLSDRQVKQVAHSLFYLQLNINLEFIGQIYIVSYLMDIFSLILALRTYEYHSCQPTSFQDRARILMGQAQVKIDKKNAEIRSKAQERLLMKKMEQQQKEDQEEFARDEEDVRKLSTQGQSMNYIELYKKPCPKQTNNSSEISINIGKLAPQDEEMCHQIYMLIRKKKPIFKCEEIKRTFGRNEQKEDKQNAKKTSGFRKVEKARLKKPSHESKSRNKQMLIPTIVIPQFGASIQMMSPNKERHQNITAVNSQAVSMTHIQQENPPILKPEAANL